MGRTVVGELSRHRRGSAPPALQTPVSRSTGDVRVSVSVRGHHKNNHKHNGRRRDHTKRERSHLCAIGKALHHGSYPTVLVAVVG